jgi:hypothetical protein
MPKEFTLTPKFKLIVDHLKAVRALDEYVNGVGLKKDMQDLTNDLKRALSRDVLRPAGWEDLYAWEGCLYSSPQSKSKWRVVRGNIIRGNIIAIEIYSAWPVQDEDEPSVGLCVPEKWKKRQQFVTKLKPPPGFEHASQYDDGELAETTSVFKYVPYESHVGPNGRFDAAAFIAAFREATKALVALKKDIDQILASLG